MKKMSMLVLGAICMSLLSGCGNSNKTLTCNYDVIEDGSSRMEYTMKFDKKGEKILSYSETAVMSYADLSDEEFESEYKEAQDACSSYKDLKGTKCEVSKEKKELHYNLKVTLSELDDTGKERLHTSEIENLNYDEFKTYMEDSKFTCK